MSDTTYNGWTNYPTWCVSLWLTNDQYTQQASQATVIAAYKDGLHEARIGPFTAEWPDDHHEAYARSTAADALKVYVDEMLDDDRADLGSDLQTWALGQVDWREIVANWLEDADLSEDEEDEEDDD